MFTVGLTGGIGSGKTTVANIFKTLGIPVYNSDDKAKLLMNNDKALKHKLLALFGTKAFVDNQLHTKYIAQIVFSDNEMLKKLENIVHPVVINDFKEWTKKQSSAYVIMENAILHKSGMDKLVDYVILVTVPVKIRIKRIKKRDNLTEIEIKKRLKIQDSDKILLKKSDYIVKNNVSKCELIKKIKNLDKSLKKMLKKC